MRTAYRIRCLLAGAWLACSPLAWAVLEVNQAPAHDLMSIKGIGPATSERIVQDREAHGAFRDWNDLIVRVRGVGPTTAQRFSDHGLRVNGRAFNAGPPTAPTARATPAVVQPLPTIQWPPVAPRPQEPAR